MAVDLNDVFALFGGLQEDEDQDPIGSLPQLPSANPLQETISLFGGLKTEEPSPIPGVDWAGALRSIQQPVPSELPRPLAEPPMAPPPAPMEESPWYKREDLPWWKRDAPIEEVATEARRLLENAKEQL